MAGRVIELLAELRGCGETLDCCRAIESVIRSEIAAKEG